MDKIVMTGIGIIAFFILIAVLNAHFSLPKCPNCGKRKTYELSRELIDSEPVYFKEKQQIKQFDNTGRKAKYSIPLQRYNMKPSEFPALTDAPEKVIVKDVYLEGRRDNYIVTYCCRICENEFDRYEHVDTKPTVINK